MVGSHGRYAKQIRRIRQDVKEREPRLGRKEDDIIDDAATKAATEMLEKWAAEVKRLRAVE